MDITSITLNMTNAKHLVNWLTDLDLEDDNLSSIMMLEIYKLHLFIMKRLESGSNTKLLVPSLKNKLNELSCKYLEYLEDDMQSGILTEGQYLCNANYCQMNHKDITELLDILEYGLVIKCNII